ncbi:hypothetical protein AB0J21_28180 [Streptomyces sp. NPDC049954]|uniref:hypothetical protein n=1 Tax=Streptomyces sp. NPDC049954 TaxID=3155779 RepID=UPI0034269D7D
MGVDTTERTEFPGGLLARRLAEAVAAGLPDRLIPRGPHRHPPGRLETSAPFPLGIGLGAVVP